MDRTPVVSFMFRSIGYDYADSILETEYNTGEILRFYGIPRHVYYDLLNSRNYGEYVDSRLKPYYKSEPMNCLL
jgi:hypothetical protein